MSGISLPQMGFDWPAVKCSSQLVVKSALVLFYTMFSQLVAA